MRVRIFQPIVPEYRVALFNGVGRRYADQIELHASSGSGEDASCATQEMPYDYRHSVVRIGPLVWQRGFTLRGLTRGDVIVVNGDIHQISTLLLAAKARLKGIGVVWWGHHLSAGSTPRRAAIRLAFAHMLGDVFLCYTNAGVVWLRQHHWCKPVYATGNTIDGEAIRSAVQKWSGKRLADFQNEHGLSGYDTIAICGVLRRKLRLDQLLRVLANPEMRKRKLKLVVIGDGECRKEWQQLARQLGVESAVIWVGALRRQDQIAPWFLSAKVFVYPGVIGLSLIHAYFYGLPVLCHGNASHHGPEFAAHVDGRTGLVFCENDEDDLHRKLQIILGDEERLKRMSETVRALAFKKYGIESMIENYCAAIETARKVVSNDRN